MDQVVSQTPHAEAVLLTLRCSELNYGTGSKLRQQISAVTAESPPQPVVLDVSSLELFSSMVIGMLVDLHQGFANAHRRFIVVGVSDLNRKTLEVTGVAKMLEIRGSFEDAMLALSQIGWRA